MKKLLFLLFATICTSAILAQPITGQWYGALKVNGTQLRLVFNIIATSNGIAATMDSPDQNAKDIPTTTASFDNNVLKITIDMAKIEYQGVLEKDNNIIGTFKQGLHSFPLNLSKNKIEKEIIKRPQDPTTPYPYYTEDVFFENKKANITLAGTLSLPKKEGLYPAVILISGSGPQDRNEEIMGHKPFLILADYLTKNGIAVLRFDDRGTALSEGKFNEATTADFATDVEAGLAYLFTRKEIKKNKIGLIGHSEGGIIAPMVASKSKDVAYIILLAGTGIQGDQLLLLQQKLIGKAAGASEADVQKNEAIHKKIFEIVNKSTNLKQLKIDLTKFIKQEQKENPIATKPAEMNDDDFVEMIVNEYANSWMQYFIKYDPAKELEKVACPVLALNGEKDLQVPPKQNLPAINKALAKGGNKKVTTKVLPNLNHLFQECNTGLPDEYKKIDQTFSPTALAEILKWLQSQTKS